MQKGHFMNLIKPKKLKLGDTIAIIAPSGEISEDKLKNGKNYFETLGFKVVLGKNVLSKDRYLAGSDEQRASDIEWAFLNPDINAIICARGGYGALRLLDKINYDLIKSNPKIFCGYSDITALSLMFLKRTGLITFSSPMIKGDFQTNKASYTQKYFLDTISSDCVKINPINLKEYSKGNAQGILWGGNLSTIVSLCGLDFIPDEKFIFFAEDLNEPVYKIDKCFRQLMNIKSFKDNLQAVLLGDFLDAGDDEQLKMLFKELALELRVPVYSGYPASHSETKATFPIGGMALLEDGILTVDY